MPKGTTAIAFTGSEGAILKLRWGAAAADNTAPPGSFYLGFTKGLICY